MKNSLKYLLLILICAPIVFSQNDGAANTGMSFLKLGVTSRSIALGDAVVSYAEDASANHYNPAAMFFGPKVNVLFTHNEQVLGMRTEYLAAKLKLSKFSFGINVNNTAVDDIEVREIPGEPIASFSSQNFSLGLSAAYRVTENISLGLTGKFLYEKIYVDNASGFAFDFGGIYSQNRISFGLAFSNVGSMSELRVQETQLPASLRGGASYLFDIASMNSTLRIGLDGYKVMDGGSFHAHTGAELIYKEFLAIRVGYQSGYENKNLTTGLGIKYKVFNLDYAFVPYKYSVGSSHTITLGTNF